jgi:mRNA interferase RelE/StbE
MPYEIEWLRAASHSFDRLPSLLQRRIMRAVDALADDPRPSGARVVVSGGGALRLRVGDYRIIYELDDKARKVLIVKVAHRSDVYR